MKTEQLKEWGLTEEQIKAVFAENGKDVEKEKGKLLAVQDELNMLKTTASTYESEIDNLKSNSATADEYKTKLEVLQGEIKENEEKHKARLADEELTNTITSTFGDKKFTSDYVKNGIIADMKAQIQKAENKGKGYNDIFTELTKDKENIFMNENNIVMGGINSGANIKQSEESQLRAAMGLSPSND